MFLKVFFLFAMQKKVIFFFVVNLFYTIGLFFIFVPLTTTIVFKKEDIVV